MLTAAEGDFAQGYLARSLQGLAHHGESLGLAVILRNDEIGLLVIFRIDFAGVDELGDLDRTLRRDAQVLDLVGLDHDVFAFAILVPLHDVALLDRTFFTFAGDFLVPDAFAGGPAELMESNFGLRFGSGKQVHTEGDKRDLYLTCPKGSRHSNSPIFMPTWPLTPEMASSTIGPNPENHAVGKANLGTHPLHQNRAIIISLCGR